MINLVHKVIEYIIIFYIKYDYLVSSSKIGLVRVDKHS